MKYSQHASETRQHIPNIILVGMTGGGKSTVGRYLAGLMGLGFIDVDDLICQRSGKQSISKLFQELGESRFREIEAEAIQLLARVKNHVIISGAGAVENPENMSMLKSLGTIVWLSTPIPIIVKNLAGSDEEMKKRPLLADAALIDERSAREAYLTKKITDLLEHRRPFYEQAQYVVEHSFANPETAALAIKRLLMGHKD